MKIGAGDRSSRILFERPTEGTTNEYNERVEGDPAIVARAWARVRFGTAQEKREAAQESAVQSATFECLSAPALRSVVATDRIRFDGSAWDISEIAPLDRMKIRFTATRRL